MRFYPTKIQFTFACFFIFSIALNLGCAKDTDLLLDSVIEQEDVSSIEKEDNTPQATESEEEIVVAEEETTPQEPTEVSLESRTTSFSPTNDAHYQSGKAYNQSIIRLDEGNRTSYLMFDLSPIAALNGEITDVTLQFTIESDNGSGNINIFKASSSNWSEKNLSDDNIPQIEVQIGSLLKEYTIGETETVDLDASVLLPEISTLILDHKNGNDLAIASKEHASQIGPKLVVAYQVPPGTEEIVIPEVITPEEETTEEETTEENTPTNTEPIAIADATPSSGGVPLDVSFTGSNSSDDKAITSFVWDFKDGSSSTTANPSHTFTKAGSYEVLLTVTDAEGLTTSDTVTITVSDTPNAAPKAVVSATPVSGEAPLEVTFKGSSSTDDNSISSYAWDLKDGVQENTADFKHTYTEPGTYEAELTVEDENGLSDKETITITVTEPTNSAPIARTSANKTLGEAPLLVQFTGDNSTDDNGITSYSWNFKDGSSASTTANPSHTFATAGTYVVELTVSDEEGLTHKNTITIRVTEAVAENEAPVARVSANKTSGEAPLSVQFTGNQSSDDKAITSYLWNFKDGATSSSANPSHIFTQAGSYSVDLTVKDSEGASSTKSITISVTNPVVINTPPGFYVATNGTASNSGTSPSSPWSLEHAFKTARPGDNVYVKAGNYGNKQPIMYNSGNPGSPIKFIGYTNSPGDIASTQGSTFKYGESLNANKMPLLQGSSTTQGIGLDLNGSYVEIHNFQITKYKLGLNSKGKNVVLKNIIVTNNGEQNNNNSQTGVGMVIRGDYSRVENCFNLNSNSIGITLKGASNSVIRNTNVYSDNIKNPGGYYLFISSGSQNNVIENCIAYRDKNADLHRGHGIVLKDEAVNNIVRNCKTFNTGLEVNFSGVHSNTFENIEIKGSFSSDNSEYSSTIKISNGAHDNTFKNIDIENARFAVNFVDFDDGFSGSGANLDRNEGGQRNKFIGLKANNIKYIIGATSVEVGAAAFSNNNEFQNCSFSNVTREPFFSYQTMNGTKFTNCSFTNLPSNKMTELYNGGSFSASFPNCTFTNIGFPKPN